MARVLSLESFRFEDENEYKYEIELEVFARVLKKRHPGKLHFYTFFYRNVSTVIHNEGG